MGLRLGKWLTRPEHQHDRTEDPGPIGVQAHDRLHVVVGAQLVREVPDGQRETRKVPDGSNLLTCASPEGQVPCIQQKIDDKELGEQQSAARCVGTPSRGMAIIPSIFRCAFQRKVVHPSARRA
jgi:hypothetical protein